MIEINNLTNFAVDKKFFVAVAKKVLKGENRMKENISVAFVSPAEIKKLNRKYRGKNKPTDVLAFGEDYQSPIPNPQLNSFSEVVICPAVVKKDGEELEKMLIHGILHILGYEHEKSKRMALEMEKKQEKYLSKIK
ncbi:MAG: rRNA maturation RNase YbeY [Candidatus Staskawiczbacteria bacterium]|nr:rRNA maturation RNase YbeY [Candidatus Staskawiczbacteria bacterium]